MNQNCNANHPGSDVYGGCGRIPPNTRSSDDCDCTDQSSVNNGVCYDDTSINYYIVNKTPYDFNIKVTDGKGNSEPEWGHWSFFATDGMKVNTNICNLGSTAQNDTTLKAWSSGWGYMSPKDESSTGPQGYINLDDTAGDDKYHITLYYNLNYTTNKNILCGEGKEKIQCDSRDMSGTWTYGQPTVYITCKQSYYKFLGDDKSAAIIFELRMDTPSDGTTYTTCQANPNK